MLKALVAYKNVFPNDAVGYDAIEEVRCLQNAGWEVGVYAESIVPSLRHLTWRNPRPFLDDETAIIVYHHAVSWDRGLAVLGSSRCRRVIKYHNITPAHFFIPYSMRSFNECSMARRQNEAIARLGVDMIIADSKFNARDFAIHGMPEDRLQVVAPFNRIETLSHAIPNAYIHDRLMDGKLNVCFVGRIAPNKGHLSIIYLAHHYRVMYGSEIRFIIVGGLDVALSGYYLDLQRLAGRLGISRMIEFVGQVSDEKLAAYLNASHVFLVLSEHEGFCIPIIEAQAFGLPILARDSGAVGETAGENQLVYEKDVDFETLASALRVLHERSDVRSYLVREGKRNAADYATGVLRRLFLNSLEAVG